MAATKQREYKNHLRKKDEYDVLLAQVQSEQIRNLPYNMWTQAHLKTMIKWYKRDGDEKLPFKMSEQIARYVHTYYQGDLRGSMLPDGFQAAVIFPFAENATAVPPTADNAAPVSLVFETKEEEVPRTLFFKKLYDNFKCVLRRHSYPPGSSHYLISGGIRIS